MSLRRLGITQMARWIVSGFVNMTLQEIRLNRLVTIQTVRCVIRQFINTTPQEI